MCPDCEQWWWQWRQRLWYLDRVWRRGGNFYRLSKFWIFLSKPCLLEAKSNLPTFISYLTRKVVEDKSGKERVYTKWKPPKNKLTQVIETWCHQLVNLFEYWIWSRILQTMLNLPYAQFTFLNPRKSKERKQAKEKDPTSRAKRGPVR